MKETDIRKEMSDLLYSLHFNVSAVSAVSAVRAVTAAIAAIFFLFLPGTTAVVSAGTLSEPQTWQVAAAQAVMYIVPDQNTPEIDTLVQNDLCTITETQLDEQGELWGRTSNTNGTGWILLSQCLKISCDESTSYMGNVQSANPNGPASYATTGYYMIAHGGSRTAGATMNTLAAFRQAGEEGFWAIEADLQLYNGKLVMEHDTADSKSPLFSDYLDICKQYGCVALIDLKRAFGSPYAANLQTAVDLVKSKGMLDQVIWQCSYIPYLEVIADYAPKAHIWVLAGSTTTLNAALGNALKLNGEGINLDYTNPPSLEYLQQMRDADLVVSFYTIYSTKGLKSISYMEPKYIMLNQLLD